MNGIEKWLDHPKNNYQTFGLCFVIIWLQLTLKEVDITKSENRDWYMKFRYDIPVFHLNGKYLMKHRVDTTLLEQELTALSNTSSDEWVHLTYR